MKILHFAHTYFPVFGGTTSRLSNLFTKDGRQHKIIVPYIGSQYVPSNITELNYDDHYENILVKRTQLTFLKNSTKPGIEYLSKIINWKKNARELTNSTSGEKYDLVYGHNPMEFSLAAKKYSIEHDIPLIYEVHGFTKDSLFLSSNVYKRLYNRFGNHFIVQIEKKILNHAQCIIVQTKSMKNRTIREYGVKPEKIKVVYNGVDIKKFEPNQYGKEKTSLRKKINQENKIVCSYFGFLDNNNGINFLLAALTKLPDSIKNKIKVLIVGRGPLTKQVQEFADKNEYLDYLGLVEYDKMPQYFALTDIFFIPRPSNNATENLIPMKLLEAMAMENIVLVSNVKGMTEVVTDGQNGIVHRVGDISSFSRRLIHIVNKIKEYETVRKNAKNTVIEKYLWNRSRERLSGVFDKF